MRRGAIVPRLASLGVAGLLAILVPLVVVLLPVPYVLLSPGPTADTLRDSGGRPVIQLAGRQTYPTDGTLSLTTVAVTGAPGRDIPLLQALAAWVDGETAVVPRAAVYPPRETAQQAERRNTEEMTSSQLDATAAAFRELEVPVEAVVVQTVVEGAPASGRLRQGDQVLAVDGRPVTAAQQVREAVSAHRPGEEVVVRVRREGREVEERIRTEARGEGAARRAVIGVVAGEKYPVTVDIKALDEQGRDIGGPSAGLMFALGIIDKLTPGALTGGTMVAGTGTIDATGQVGAIGGIQQKLVGATEAGARVFLTPERNCADAVRAVPEGLRLVKVRTLDDALSALEALRAGRSDLPGC